MKPSPELAAHITLLREKVASGEATDQEIAEGIRLRRADRYAAMPRPKLKKAKKKTTKGVVTYKCPECLEPITAGDPITHPAGDIPTLVCPTHGWFEYPKINTPA